MTRHCPDRETVVEWVPTADREACPPFTNSILSPSLGSKEIPKSSISAIAVPVHGGHRPSEGFSHLMWIASHQTSRSNGLPGVFRHCLWCDRCVGPRVSGRAQCGSSWASCGTSVPISFRIESAVLWASLKSFASVVLQFLNRAEAFCISPVR